jgi:crossover junction endodeoxyribonuclease RuvC
MAMLHKGAVDVFDIPTTTRTVNKKEKRQIDPYQLSAWLEIQRPLIKFAVVEQVGTMPGQGVTSMFSFGRSVGIVEGVLAAYCYPVTIVPPKLWQSACQMRVGKDGARARAMELFPAYADLFKLKKHDGRADAALMAWYGATVLDRRD